MDFQAELNETAILNIMEDALEQGQFIAYYQPQYNHATHVLIGAEALARWRHPQYGIIPPSVFIPVFEKNGFISKLDLHIFAQVCKFINHCMKRDIPVIPISVNITRFDIFKEDFVDRMEEVRQRYEVPAKLLHLEVTESAAMGSIVKVNSILQRMHECGYTICMDDFGSGYSSLNVLKDIDVDMLKLDMEFVHTDLSERKRGSTILCSVVRMAKWLGLPVIAEGVETLEQADFLRSIGCLQIQGFLYSRPLPEAAYEELVKGSQIAEPRKTLVFAERLNNHGLWDTHSLDTLIFSELMGGAAIFSYNKGEIDIVRANSKYMHELGYSTEEDSVIGGSMLSNMDEYNSKIFIDAIEQAIATNEEVGVDTKLSLGSERCGQEEMYIHNDLRVLNHNGEEYLIFVAVRNVTMQVRRITALSMFEQQFRNVVEQANIYYWEYNILTKEMHPCFRCMRDLGLPSVVRNYPEPAIEAGIIPPEYATMYREWHEQLAQGVRTCKAEHLGDDYAVNRRAHSLYRQVHLGARRDRTPNQSPRLSHLGSFIASQEGSASA